jgi:hypothetical protein
MRTAPPLSPQLYSRIAYSVPVAVAIGGGFGSSRFTRDQGWLHAHWKDWLATSF